MLQFSILGPIEVRGEEGELRLGGKQQRALLALLLLEANHVVPTEVLIDKLWGEHPPPAARASLQNAIHQLRRLLGAELIENRAPGYRLLISTEQLDLLRFEALVRRARGEAPPERAATLGEALGLWRGQPLEDLAYEQGLADHVRYLGERRIETIEERLGVELALGRHADLVAELEGLVAQHDRREKLLAHLMLALYRTGRQAEANERFQAYRRRIDEESGQLPGPELQELHRSILRHDPWLVPTAGPERVPHADRYSQVVRAVLASRLVPVVGPLAGAPEAAAAAPDPATAAAHLARVFSYPADRPLGLTRVSQYVAVTHGVGALYDELHALYDPDYEPGPVDRALASLAGMLRERGLSYQLVVTTGFGRTLERAFAEAGEEVDIVSYVAFGRDRGKFLHVAPDGEARVIDEPNVEVGLSTGERTIVLKIHGGAVGSGDGMRESYVVSEDDYIDYLSQTPLSALLPVGLAARLSRSSFLFLGYDLDDWSLRVFLRRLWGVERVGYRSWAVGPATDPLAAEWWRQCGVDAFDVALDDYVAGLLAELAAGQAEEIA